METRRLQYLLELSRLGSMRAVAELLGATTSTVSQQIAMLAQETGRPLLEPDGRGVRLTPAGRRLADHARVILAAVDAARLDLDPSAEPSGTLRIAGFATAIRRALMPIIRDLSREHPALGMEILEHEPAEALKKLAMDQIDLALTYDYNLAPDPCRAGHRLAAIVDGALGAGRADGGRGALWCRRRCGRGVFGLPPP